MAIAQKVCVNCNLYTRADQAQCLHGNHRNDIKMPLVINASEKKPTAVDLMAYQLWLEGLGPQGSGVIH